jgi:hypothetical protein
MEQYNAFEGEDFSAMSTAQFDALQSVTPIVLDLDGNGVTTLSAAQGVQFDLAATGSTAQVGWVGSGDGLLVRDINGDGLINDGTELFGGATQLANGQRAGNGYVAMAALDSNGDGKLSAADAAFNELKVWVDGDADGQTDTGELLGLLDAGVLEINLDYALGSEVDNGNLLGMVGSYTATDGSEQAMADVWFAKDSGTTPTLDDLLAETGDSLLADASQPATASGTAEVPAEQRTANSAAFSLAQRISLEEELLRNQNPLL